MSNEQFLGRDQWTRRDPEECLPFPAYGVMVSDDKSKGARPVPAARQKARAPADRPFDTWLQKQLHAMYDEIAGEPLPSDLLDLIDTDRDAAGHDDRSADKGASPGHGPSGSKKPQ